MCDDNGCVTSNNVTLNDAHVMPKIASRVTIKIASRVKINIA